MKSIVHVVYNIVKNQSIFLCGEATAKIVLLSRFLL